MDAPPVGIPVPRVPSPPISAPPFAREPQGIQRPIVPIDRPEGRLEELLDRLPSLVPRWASEGLFTVVKNVNRHIFPSTPPGAPIPAQPGSWNFAVIGDYGGGAQPLTDVTGNLAKGRPELVLTTGDNVYYSGTEREFQKKWDPDRFFGGVRKNFPVLPSLGNHDIKKGTDPYFRRFPELGNARFYSFDKNDVHFVALNTNEALDPTSPQFKWLEQDLAASTADWKVLYFHHPMYSGYPIGSSPLKGYLAPLIAKHGVDLVFSGHEHNYSRTKMLNTGGTIEVISGNGGQTLHPFVSPQPAAVGYRDVDFGHVEVEVGKDQLIGRYVVRDGSTRDTFVIPNLTPGHVPTALADAAGGAAMASQAASAPAASPPAVAPAPTPVPATAPAPA